MTGYIANAFRIVTLLAFFAGIILLVTGAFSAATGIITTLSGGVLGSLSLIFDGGLSRSREYTLAVEGRVSNRTEFDEKYRLIDQQQGIINGALEKVPDGEEKSAILARIIADASHTIANIAGDDVAVRLSALTEGPRKAIEK